MPPFVFIFVWLMQYSRRTRQRTLIRLFSITRLFLSLLIYYGRELYMMHGSIGVFLLKERRDEYMVGSFDHCCLAFTPGIRLTKTGDFHMTER